MAVFAGGPTMIADEEGYMIINAPWSQDVGGRALFSGPYTALDGVLWAPTFLPWPKDENQEIKKDPQCGI